MEASDNYGGPGSNVRENFFFSHSGAPKPFKVTSQVAFSGHFLVFCQSETNI
jgi:hypothetical protein